MGASRAEPAYTYTDTPTPKDPEPEPLDDADDEAEDTIEEPETMLEEPSNPFGEGSFVGTEPPEGYTIKGNDRSMKYHVPESGGYERTIADVWFNSEDAAQAAGFTRAQR